MGFSEAVNNYVTRCYLEGIPRFNHESVHVVRLEPRGTILHHPLSLRAIVESLQCRFRPVVIGLVVDRVTRFKYEGQDFLFCICARARSSK